MPINAQSYATLGHCIAARVLVSRPLALQVSGTLCARGCAEA